MSRDKLFVILSFLIAFLLTGLLLVLDWQKISSHQDLEKAALFDKKTSFSEKEVAKLPLESDALNPDIWIKPNVGLAFLPYRDWNVEEPQIEARSAILMQVGQERVLFQKNIEDHLPIASLTKIMTGIVILENGDLSKTLKISKEAVNQEGEAGKLVIGEEISVKDLVYALLLESSNDAAFALAESLGKENFINLMNKKAEILGLKNTHFSNAAGFDNSENFSSVQDLAELLKYSFSNEFLWQILRTRAWEIKNLEGKIIHRWENTNKLLGVLPNLIGGKTGWTQYAGGCMALVLDRPQNKSKMILVLLGTPNENKRFEESKKLIDWAYRAYQW